ncbi:hypothetical protein [Roseibium sp.]|uniref:hypothetical protein n=1 Tax=Roseibium sp. TaxID=1936156 RepID=UPI003A96BE41
MSVFEALESVQEPSAQASAVPETTVQAAPGAQAVSAGILDDQTRAQTLTYLQSLSQARRHSTARAPVATVASLEELRLSHGDDALRDIENPQENEN